VERLKDPSGDPLAGGQIGRVVSPAELLVALPGEHDLVEGAAVLEAGGQPVANLFIHAYFSRRSP